MPDHLSVTIIWIAELVHSTPVLESDVCERKEQTHTHISIKIVVLCVFSYNWFNGSKYLSRRGER